MRLLPEEPPAGPWRVEKLGAFAAAVTAWTGRRPKREGDEGAAEEVPFLRADRPWERAGFIVAGTASLAHDPSSEVVTAPP